MKTLQQYIKQFTKIARELGYTGESIDVLVRLAANAVYIDEVENMVYTREASIDKAMLMNSKIQHCMDNMYSVFRGRCPRVILKFKPTKYFSFNVYDKIITSNSFSVYYLGYYDPEAQNNSEDNDTKATGNQSKSIS